MLWVQRRGRGAPDAIVWRDGRSVPEVRKRPVVAGPAARAGGAPGVQPASAPRGEVPAGTGPAHGRVDGVLGSAGAAASIARGDSLRGGRGRVGSEVLGITIYSHRDLEQLLRGFNAAYNARRQSVLDGNTPDRVVAERLKARRQLANAKPHGRAGPADVARARLIAEAAKEVSQPDS